MYNPCENDNLNSVKYLLHIINTNQYDNISNISDTIVALYKRTNHNNIKDNALIRSALTDIMIKMYDNVWQNTEPNTTTNRKNSDKYQIIKNVISDKHFRLAHSTAFAPEENEHNTDNTNILSKLCEHGDVELVQQIIDKSSFQDADCAMYTNFTGSNSGRHYPTPLAKAVTKLCYGNKNDATYDGQVDVIKLLLSTPQFKPVLHGLELGIAQSENIANTDKEAILKLLCNHPNYSPLNIFGSKRTNALLLSIEHGNTLLFDAIIDSSVSEDIINVSKLSPSNTAYITLAARGNNNHIFNTILGLYAKNDDRILKKHSSIIDENGNTALFYAVANANQNMLDKLLEINPNIHELNIDKENLLMVLCRSEDSAKFIQYVTRYPGLLKQLDQDGNSLLHHVVTNGNQEMLEYLIQNRKEYNIDINHANYDGITPLMALAGKMHNIPATTADDNDGQSKDKESMLALLLQCHELKHNKQDKFGNTALHYAAAYGSEDTIDQLLSNHKIHCNILNKQNHTPIQIINHFREFNKEYEIPKNNIIKSQEFNLQSYDNIIQNKELPKKLIRAGASLSVYGYQKQTAIDTLKNIAPTAILTHTANKLANKATLPPVAEETINTITAHTNAQNIGKNVGNIIKNKVLETGSQNLDKITQLDEYQCLVGHYERRKKYGLFNNFAKIQKLDNVFYSQNSAHPPLYNASDVSLLLDSTNDYKIIKRTYDDLIKQYQNVNHELSNLSFFNVIGRYNLNKIKKEIKHSIKHYEHKCKQDFLNKSEMQPFTNLINNRNAKHTVQKLLNSTSINAQIFIDTVKIIRDYAWVNPRIKQYSYNFIDLYEKEKFKQQKENHTSISRFFKRSKKEKTDELPRKISNAIENSTITNHLMRKYEIAQKIAADLNHIKEQTNEAESKDNGYTNKLTNTAVYITQKLTNRDKHHATHTVANLASNISNKATYALSLYAGLGERTRNMITCGAYLTHMLPPAITSTISTGIVATAAATYAYKRYNQHSNNNNMQNNIVQHNTSTLEDQADKIDNQIGEFFNRYPDLYDQINDKKVTNTNLIDTEKPKQPEQSGYTRFFQSLSCMRRNPKPSKKTSSTSKKKPTRTKNM